MSESMKCPELLPEFAAKMTAQLLANADRGDGWETMTAAELIRAMRRQLREIRRLARADVPVHRAGEVTRYGIDGSGASPEALAELRRRSANVANYAMFLDARLASGAFAAHARSEKKGKK